MKLYITEAPIFVLLIFYLPIVLFILWRIARSKRFGKIAKAVVIPVFLIIAYVIPLGDVTLNSLAMAKVCPKAGLHVYKQVKVEGYFDPSGSSEDLKRLGYRYIEYARFGEKPIRLERSSDGTIKKIQLENITAEYEVVYEASKIDDAIRAKQSRYWIRNRITGESLGEWLVYGALPGWLDRFLVIRWFGGSMGGCGDDPKALAFREIILQPK